MNESGAPPSRDLRSFGRRRGRKLSPTQAQRMATDLADLSLDLSTPAPTDLAALYASAAVSAVWLEIGFGGAEHLLWQAVANPDVGLIGCEPFEEGVAKALSGIEARGLTNARLHADDARPLVRWLPSASIARVFVLFPDPWPKARHRKRRLLSQTFVADLARVIAPGGELRFGTDIGDYARTGLSAILDSGFFGWRAEAPVDWRERPADWPETRYEAKAAAAGRRRYYFRFERKAAADVASRRECP